MVLLLGGLLGRRGALTLALQALLVPLLSPLMFLENMFLLADVMGLYARPHFLISRRSGGPSMSTDEEFTLRVSNVSDETTQDDLYEMFQQFGRLHRVHLVMDKRTGESRGFAFVNYLRKRYHHLVVVRGLTKISDAEGVLHAVEVERKKLGLHNFIFNIEWSKSAQQGK